MGRIPGKGLDTVIRDLDRIDLPEYVTWYELGDRAVVIDLRSGTRLRLNASAAFLWRHATRLCSTRGLIAELEAIYEVTTEEAARAVAEWVGQLRDRQLIYPLYPDAGR